MYSSSSGRCRKVRESDGKVFCGDCKWDGFFDSTFSDCRFITGYKDTHRKRKVSVRNKLTKQEENCNNDCANYKRKWWKFWR